MSSSSVSRVWEDESVQAVIFAVGLVVGSGLTVCIMRRNVRRLEDYVELLRREVRRLRIVVDDHLALFEGAQDGFSSGQVLSPPPPALSPPSPPAYPSAPSPPVPPPETHCGSTLSQTAGSVPHPHKIHHRQSPRSQILQSTPHRPCSPSHSPASDFDGEDYFPAPNRSDDVQSVNLDDKKELRGPAAATSSASNRDQDLTQVFCHVDRLMDGSDYEKHQAYNILINKSKDRQMLRNANFLWRLAKATYFVSQLEGSSNNKIKQKNLVYKSKDFAGAALQIDNNNPDAHKWWAITLGSIGEYEGTTAKIQNGYQFKKHIEKSIELNPQDAASHHLLGRWCYGVYMLPWMERKVAAALFATPPSATIDDALRHFLDAERINPGRWKENQLYIAKCYVEKKDYRKAVVWLEKASHIAVKNRIDEQSQKEVDSLLTQYRGYRM